MPKSSSGRNRGPYPADGQLSSECPHVQVLSVEILNSSLFTGNVAQGVPLTLAIKLVNTNANCAVLSGYAFIPLAL